MLATYLYDKYKAKKAAKEEEKRLEAAGASKPSADPQAPKGQNADTSEQPKH